ncbi:MAG: elongation factor [Candidatus Cloacimonetes bacterium HGW-Cloacimonetes-2]|jgi:uncharacterized YigZ family protein|nr:MAG: elongation factor [Candidatus Cloacimonetes bacterium HGW-Cloacimonetes-2]
MAFTIREIITYREKIQRSDFICSLYPISNQEEMRAALSKHQKDNATATHNCYAYILGSDQQVQYYSDAGEPSGTAGKPMLNALLRGELTNVLAVVTRHFGGIKLGVKGLIEAYGSVVAEAILKAERQQFIEYIKVIVNCDYNINETVVRYCRDNNALIEDLVYADSVTISIKYPQTDFDGLRAFLDGLKMHSRLDYTSPEMTPEEI